MLFDAKIWNGWSSTDANNTWNGAISVKKINLATRRESVTRLDSMEHTYPMHMKLTAGLNNNFIMESAFIIRSYSYTCSYTSSYCWY